MALPFATSDHPKPDLRLPWWIALVVAGAVAAAGSAWVVTVPGDVLQFGTAAWWAATTLSHAPFLLIVVFLVGGFVERLGYLWRGRAAQAPGLLPAALPTVCVQLPMFEEEAVARRAVLTAAALRWPRHLLSIQVLDDSVHPASRAIVDAVVADVAARGVRCTVQRREERDGYKAGALELGRWGTDAEFLVVFDADFAPTPDYLLRLMPYFYGRDGRPITELAMVQARWGHLNRAESPLTRAQSLWVDDHHTLQMSWRSAAWGFVNFTGTAGIWRASAIAHAGGWRATSLVEDCELSFRHLFAGYRTRFVKEVVARSELPATVTAYRAQQKRWTQGWAQLQRMHLATLLRRYRTTPLRHAHLLYHMLIPTQWALWGAWTLLLPILIDAGLWFGAAGPVAGIASYTLPLVAWLALAGALATVETRRVDPLDQGGAGAGVSRLLPYTLLNVGMLPHQVAAYVQGLLGPMHSEFERTPKTASTGAAPGRPDVRWTAGVRIPWVTTLAETFFIVYQSAWAVRFFADGSWWCGLGSVVAVVCVGYLMWRSGDDRGRRFFVVPAARPSAPRPDRARAAAAALPTPTAPRPARGLPAPKSGPSGRGPGMMAG